MKNYKFELEYNSQNISVNSESFFEEEGNLPFDTHSLVHTKIMMEEIQKALDLQDTYSLKKLEIVLRYELPFFAVNRRLIKNWLMDNFIY